MEAGRRRAEAALLLSLLGHREVLAGMMRPMWVREVPAWGYYSGLNYPSLSMTGNRNW
jgi:hypothetical protein